MQQHRTLLYPLVFILATFCSACIPQEVTGTYLARIPFQGIDPRFSGQNYQWVLDLETDGSFSFTFELPLAVYIVDGRELIGKAEGMTSGRWKKCGSSVILFRDSGEASLGSLDTMSFSFFKNLLVIRMRDGKAALVQGDNHIILVKTLINQ